MIHKKTLHDTHNIITQNKKAYYQYILEDFFDAGIVLEGWEVKSIRYNNIQINNSYIQMIKNEFWLLNSIIHPVNYISQNRNLITDNNRKILLKKNEINKLLGKIHKKNYTIIPIYMYWKKKYIKLKIALGKGKKLYDKRHALKELDWKREKDRIIKQHTY